MLHKFHNPTNQIKSKRSQKIEIKELRKIRNYKIVNQIYRQNQLSYTSMTSYLSYNYKKPSTSYGSSNTQSRKKIKHFSYSHSDKIGKGFSSIVYKGTNDLTNETVAIKAIDMKGVKDSISREMLDCQIEALTTLNHSNILKCFDVVRQPSHCFIITEFCNQGDLSELVKKKRRMTESETLKVLKDIVSGFVEMGEKRFLHRDLKLANIFMNQGSAIIADFGFAKKHTNVPEREKYNVGSPLYMSPEALKKNIYSIKNDIWSIGIMAFEMLHGETPWECRTEKELIDKMTRIPVKFRDSLNISSPTKNFIKKCLQVEEKNRMSLEDLKVWLHSSNTSSHQERELPKIDLGLQLRKPFSNIENLNNEAPRGLSSRQEKSHSFANNSRPNLINKENHYERESYKSKENKAYNKENNPKGVSVVSLPKQVIEANNNVLVIEINTFRLIYKILEKLRKFEPHAKELIRTLGAEVLKRVRSLKSFCCDDEETCNKTKLGLYYNVKQTESYFNQLKNPSIKKYKSVVKQYFKKYTTEIKMDDISTPSVSVTEVLRQHLKQKGYLSQREMSPEELSYVYWMVEFVQMKKEVKKEYLDEVIDPKHLQLNKQYLEDRIRDI